MQYWQSILNQIQGQSSVLFPQLFTQKTKEQRDLRAYYLGEHYPDIYLTKREAECAFWIVQDYTIARAAIEMGLSARTVEFYVKNMKLKLRCASKKRLVQCLLETTLLVQLAQDGLCVTKH